MEFDEVNSYIYRDRRQVQPQTGTPSLEHNQPVITDHINPYNSLIRNYNQSTHQSTHQSITRKPTLANFVNRLKQQSSRTRFVREYKRMASVLDPQQTDSAYFIPDDGNYMNDINHPKLTSGR